MVASLLHPLNIFIVGLGAGFLMPLVDRLGRSWVAAVFILALATMTLISGVAVLTLLQGAAPIEILTGGTKPPYAINLRMGFTESIFAFCVNLVALLGASYVARERYGVLLLSLLLVMGIQGMVMTRDLLIFLCSWRLSLSPPTAFSDCAIRRQHCRRHSNFSWPQCWHRHSF